jgi:hypothetical protein
VCTFDAETRESRIRNQEKEVSLRTSKGSEREEDRDKNNREVIPSSPLFPSASFFFFVRQQNHQRDPLHLIPSSSNFFAGLT